MNPETFVGVDLIDCNAKSPRPVDVAILRPTGDGAGVIRFEQFRFTHPTDSAWPMNVASAVEKFQNGRTVFVVDGPQALAQPPNKTRVVERLLRTPAHTPSEAPLPRSRPFAGYIRTSIDFFNALVLQGFHLADLDGVGQEQVNLIETYPGAAWPRLHSGPSPLRSKSTIEGRKQRTAILEGIGCRFESSKLATHDELDAALCAALGWRWFVPTDGLKVALTGDVQAYRDDFRILREGRMLMPVTSRIVERSPSVVSKREAKAPELANDAALPQCDWVYFANPSGTEQTITLELAENSGVIARTAYNELGRAIANVQHLKPNETILLAYGEGQYEPLCRCRIDPPDEPLSHDGREFAAVAEAEASLVPVLNSAGYEVDPVLKQHTVIPVTIEEDLQGSSARFPRPARTPQTIWRWDEVFTM